MSTPNSQLSTKAQVQEFLIPAIMTFRVLSFAFSLCAVMYVILADHYVLSSSLFSASWLPFLLFLPAIVPFLDLFGVLPLSAYLIPLRIFPSFWFSSLLYRLFSTDRNFLDVVVDRFGLLRIARVWSYEEKLAWLQQQALDAPVRVTKDNLISLAAKNDSFSDLRVAYVQLIDQLLAPPPPLPTPVPVAPASTSIFQDVYCFATEHPYLTIGASLVVVLVISHYTYQYLYGSGAPSASISTTSSNAPSGTPSGIPSDVPANPPFIPSDIPLDAPSATSSSEFTDFTFESDPIPGIDPKYLFTPTGLAEAEKLAYALLYTSDLPSGSTPPSLEDRLLSVHLLLTELLKSHRYLLGEHNMLADYLVRDVIPKARQAYHYTNIPNFPEWFKYMQTFVKNFRNYSLDVFPAVDSLSKYAVTLGYVAVLLESLDPTYWRFRNMLKYFQTKLPEPPKEVLAQVVLEKTREAEKLKPSLDHTVFSSDTPPSTDAPPLFPSEDMTFKDKGPSSDDLE